MESLLAGLAAAPNLLLVADTVIDEQYRIERMLGHGAMGVVYLARDLRLQRDVAIKVALERSAHALARASREAVSLARISHPNVVVVHQVGELDGRVYVAMEYIDGVTARAWSRDRTIAEIVAMYIAAGAGLAAAHDAGLVHRDIKADNILVGSDQRPRITDFGLASGADMARAGTPAYMAPEQTAGGAVDARADQFAFCASLWEALHGQRFPARARSVPRHIDLALRRGLATDRDARWPAMSPLLVELGRHPVRRRAAAAGVAIVASLVLGVGIVCGSSDNPDPCADGAASIATQWTHGLRVSDAIIGRSSAAWIHSTAAAATATLDTWATRWSTTYRGVCTNTVWTPRLRDSATDCLARDQFALGATVEALSSPGVDPGVAERLLASLPDPESCADPTYLDATVAPVDDPALRREVATVAREVPAVGVLEESGQRRRADELLDSLDASAARLDDPPLRADLQRMRGVVARWRGDDKAAFPLLHDAYLAARRAGDRISAADSASEATLALLNLSRDADAAEWAQLADVEVARIAEPAIRARVLRTLSIVATARNDAARGIELADRAISLELGGPNHRATHASLQARADAYAGAGKFELALKDLDAIESVFPPNAQLAVLSVVEHQRALVFDQMGRYDDAVAAARKALALAEATVGPDSDLATNAVGVLGVGLNHAGHLAEALSLIDRSLATNRKLDGARSYNVASDLNNRCDLLNRMHRYDEAIADGNEAIAIWTDVIGPDALEIGVAELNVAIAMKTSNRVDDAAAMAIRSLAIVSKQPDHPAIPMDLVIRGAASRAHGRYADARADLERAIALLTSRPGDPTWLASAQLELAAVDVASDRKGEASPLATAARDAFRTRDEVGFARAEAILAQVNAR